MAKQSRFTTRSRRAGKDQELGWGPQGSEWENEIENAEGIDVVRGAARPSMANGVGSVAYYEFEQDVTDQWSGYDGSVNGGIRYVTDSATGDYAIDTDGSDASVYLGDFLTPDAFSFAFWMNADNNRNKSQVLNCNTFSAGIAGGYVGYDVYFNMDGGSRLLAGKPPKNSWIHVVGTYDSSSGNQRIFIDGEERDSWGNSSSNSNPGVIELFGDSGANVYNGSVDQLKFFDWALSDLEVSNLHSTGSV